MILIFILEIAGGIYAYTKRDSLQESLEKHLKTGVEVNYGQVGTAAEGVTEAIDYFQQKVKCCGITGPGDWAGSKWKNGTANKNVPDSCCKTETAGCGVLLQQIHHGERLLGKINYHEVNVFIISQPRNKIYYHEVNVLLTSLFLKG